MAFLLWIFNFPSFTVKTSERNKTFSILTLSRQSFVKLSLVIICHCLSFGFCAIFHFLLWWYSL
jgi:hypothetical protein